MPRLLRELDPLKMTSAISPPRRLLADCSPRIHRTASTTLLLPDPFGPTTAVIPGAKSNRVLSANDLNPTSSRRLSMGFRKVGSGQWAVVSRRGRVGPTGLPSLQLSTVH